MLRARLLAFLAFTLLVPLLAGAEQTQPAYVAACGRSPMPQPGEEITKPISFKRLTVVELEAKPSAPAPAEGEVVPWDQAHKHVGRRITTEGKIVSAKKLTDICFLNFHENWREHFYCAIFRDAFKDLPGGPEAYFTGKTIRVTGKVTLHKGRPQIRIENIGQVEVVAE